VELFFFSNGFRNCSIVGATFCLGFDVFDTVLVFIDGLENLVLGDWRSAREHEEHVQAALLRAGPESVLARLCIVV
jgi:hypothetical protein